MNTIVDQSFEFGGSGVLAPGKWLWLRALSWAVLLSAGAFAFFLGTQLLGPWLHLPPNFAYATFLGLPILAFVTYAFVVRGTEHRTANEVMPSARMVLDLAIGAVAGFIMVCTMLALLWAFGLYHVQHNHWQHIFDAFLFGPYLSAMMEELLFRAILLRITARAFGAGWGLTLSAILFGLAHLGHGSWLAAFEIMLNGGLVLGLLYLATGRLWMAVGLHAAWDFTEDSILGVNHRFGLLLSTPIHGRSDALTGGNFGPDASVFATLVGVLAIAVILSARRHGLFSKTPESTPWRTR